MIRQKLMSIYLKTIGLIFGDYDMNDLVMIVSIINTTEASSEGINAKTVYLSTSVRAVGATEIFICFCEDPRNRQGY